MSRGNRGFTLIEAMVAVALLGIGVAAVLGALGQISATEAKARERERMQRFATEKYAELLGTGDLNVAGLDGDFRDKGQPTWTWSASVEATGIENLESLRVEVTKRGQTTPGASADGLFYRVPEVTTTP